MMEIKGNWIQKKELNKYYLNSQQQIQMKIKGKWRKKKELALLVI